MARSIRDVMTPSPETVESSKTAAEAAKLMKKAHAGMIPVVQNGTLVGTVTDRDITLRVVAEGKDPQGQPSARSRRRTSSRSSPTATCARRSS
jgi:CBS domain-containing protein